MLRTHTHTHGCHNTTKVPSHLWFRVYDLGFRAPKPLNPKFCQDHSSGFLLTPGLGVRIWGFRVLILNKARWKKAALLRIPIIVVPYAARCLVSIFGLVLLVPYIAKGQPCDPLISNVLNPPDLEPLSATCSFHCRSFGYLLGS